MNIARYLVIAALVAFACSESMDIPNEYADANPGGCCPDGNSGEVFAIQCPSDLRLCKEIGGPLICCA